MFTHPGLGHKAVIVHTVKGTVWIGFWMHLTQCRGLEGRPSRRAGLGRRAGCCRVLWLP